VGVFLEESPEMPDREADLTLKGFRMQAALILLL
jgi:hypothetical protein